MFENEFLKHFSTSYIFKRISKVSTSDPLNQKSVLSTLLNYSVGVFTKFVTNNVFFRKITNHSLMTDIKPIFVFLFIFTQLIFPGYGAGNSGSLASTASSGIINSQVLQLLLPLFTLLYIALLLLFIFELLKNPKSLNFSKFEIILLLFLITVEVSTFFSTSPHTSFLWFLKLMRGIGVYFIFSRLTLTQNILKSICYSFLIAVLFQSTLAIAQNSYGGFIGLSIENSSQAINTNQFHALLDGVAVFRPTGTLPQGNILAFFIALSIPFCLALLFEKKLITKAISGITIIMGIFTLLLTLSRWGLATVSYSLISTLYLTWLMLREISFTFLIRTLITLTIILMIAFMTNSYYLERFTTFSIQDSSFATRMELIYHSLETIRNNILVGTGAGTFSGYIINNDFSPNQISESYSAPVHNLFLLLLSELGIFSFSLFLTIIVYSCLVFYKFFRTKYYTLHRFTQLFIIALVVSTTTFIFSGFWEMRSLEERLSIIFWMNLGLMYNILRNKDSQWKKNTTL